MLWESYLQKIDGLIHKLTSHYKFNLSDTGVHEWTYKSPWELRCLDPPDRCVLARGLWVVFFFLLFFLCFFFAQPAGFNEKKTVYQALTST